MQHAYPLDIRAGHGLNVEHICLESDEPAAAATASDVRTGPAFRFVSRLRDCETELAFSTGHRLSVHCGRPGRPLRSYVVDLRFIDTEAITGLRIAWRWWLAAMALAGLSTLGFWLAQQFAAARWHQAGLQAATLVVTAAACLGLLSLRKTRVAIELHSLHGHARVADVTGSLGSTGDARSFVAELSRRVVAARGQSAMSKQQFLRDEMREHHRLWREGVLSDAAYEDSKRRILAAHC